MHADEILAHGDQARQAGATQPDGKWIQEFKRAAEGSLYFFLTAILGHTFLTPHLHKPICDFIQDPAWMRKFLAMFRGGGKSVTISQGLPTHAFIQPKERNIYWPGKLGVDTRLLLACETIERGKDHLSVIRRTLETNPRLRALWPHVFWKCPEREADLWNNEEFVLPRVYEKARSEPSMRAVGISAATAGMHPDGKIEDDIIAEKAANSPIVMETARNWHRSSRSLINHPGSREWALGTFWAVEDVYQTEHMQDPTVCYRSKALIEEGEIQWPERYVHTDAEARAWYTEHKDAILMGRMAEKISVEQLQREHGVYFPLFYLNDPTHSALTDFQPHDVRHYTVDGERITFPEDSRDALLAAEAEVSLPSAPAPVVGRPIQWTGRQEDERMQFRKEHVRWRRA
jgi:hypothetical protein